MLWDDQVILALTTDKKKKKHLLSVKVLSNAGKNKKELPKTEEG
jgi:hypothetical protein